MLDLDRAEMRTESGWDGGRECVSDASPLPSGEAEPPCDARSHLRRCLDQGSAAVEVEAAGPAPRISLEAEVPEVLFEGMRAFLRSRPEWDQYRVITSALAGFLFQNGCADACVSQHYLNGLFIQAGE